MTKYSSTNAAPTICQLLLNNKYIRAMSYQTAECLQVMWQPVTELESMSMLLGKEDSPMV